MSLMEPDTLFTRAAGPPIGATSHSDPAICQHRIQHLGRAHQTLYPQLPSCQSTELARSLAVGLEGHSEGPASTEQASTCRSVNRWWYWGSSCSLAPWLCSSALLAARTNASRSVQPPRACE